MGDTECIGGGSSFTARWKNVQYMYLSFCHCCVFKAKVQELNLLADSCLRDFNFNKKSQYLLKFNSFCVFVGFLRSVV